MNVNAKLPVRGTSGSAGYDLAAAQTAVVPAHGKCLVKTGLSLAMPPDCYGRVAPRSGLALKRFIDVGAGVIDSDYRGELGVILFNFGNEDLTVNMGDRIAQLIFEKIKTPEIKETDSLDGTRRGEGSYGSTGMNEGSSEDKSETKVRTTQSEQNQIQSVIKNSSNQDSRKINKKSMNEPSPHAKKRSQATEARRILSARQM